MPPIPFVVVATAVELEPKQARRRRRRLGGQRVGLAVVEVAAMTTTPPNYRQLLLQLPRLAIVAAIRIIAAAVATKEHLAALSVAVEMLAAAAAVRPPVAGLVFGY